jgi:hypothetical protein
MGPQPVPVIEADARPLKIRPDKPGGMVVLNQDQMVLEPPAVRRAAERNQGTGARLDSGPEAPALEQLRQQAAPPAPAVSMLPPPMPPGAAPASPAPTSPAPGAQAQATAAAPLAPPVPAGAAPAQPAPVPAAPAAGSFRAAATGKVQVQLGALATEDAAKTEWDRLVARIPDLGAFQPRIIRLDREGQPTLWRLRTGGFADLAAARSLCEAVRTRGGNCVPLNGS